MRSAALLDRLERVKQTGPGRWIARCPAHEDRSPSLSVRELDDGRVLVHDFGGCAVGEVLATLGLEMKDLFPARLAGAADTGGYAPSHSRIPARDLLEILDHEIAVACLIICDVLENHTADRTQWARLAAAAARIGKARDHARG